MVPVAQLIEYIRNISNNTPPSVGLQTPVRQQTDGHNREVDNNNTTVADAFFSGVVYKHILGALWGQYS